MSGKRYSIANVVPKKLLRSKRDEENFRIIHWDESKIHTRSTPITQIDAIGNNF